MLIEFCGYCSPDQETWGFASTRSPVVSGGLAGDAARLEAPQVLCGDAAGQTERGVQRGSPDRAVGWS